MNVAIKQLAVSNQSYPIMSQKKVLFLCVHNSARSQMAEAYLEKYGGSDFLPDSAGLEPGKLNPLAVQVMKEEGIDISGKQTKGVFDYFKEGRIFHIVVTVCDPEAAERCPIFPGMMKKIHWPFADPSQLKGTQEEKLEQARKIRDQIKEAVLKFVEEYKSK